MMKNLKISGVERIKKTFVVNDLENPGCYMIETDGKLKTCPVLTELGVNLMQVMAFPEVDGRNTLTNDFNEAFECLGIEAARNTILREINATLSFDNGEFKMPFKPTVRLC
jgi:DNA-directed RNA polymerase beta' subunit